MNDEEYPLVSALMIVHRPRMVELSLAIKCFQDQTYPYKELIIINNASTQFEASNVNIEAQPNVFLIDTPQKLVAGLARNYAISASNGQILAQFDMDCWHHPKRLEAQIATMAENQASVCLLSRALTFSFNSGRAGYWKNGKDIILNSMVYTRPATIDYPPVEKNEELQFLNSLIQSGRTSISMDKPDLICKFHYSDHPVEDIEQSTLSKAHENTVRRILKKRREQIYC